ncbi:MAG: bacteriorhodopsin-like [Pseudomonadota bacterium]
MEELSVGQYDLIFNAFSFTFATMAAATLFFWMGRSQVAPAYKTAMTITGLVTFIAAYHYYQIFNSWSGAFDVNSGTIATTGYAFNEAYRYVDWLLTVPLLLVELILVMNLSRSETISKATKLGLAAALMIILGYPGEVADDAGQRWLWGILSMLPFLYIVVSLFTGLKDSIQSQPEDVRGLVSTARWVVVLSWSFYPVVYFAGAIAGLESPVAITIVEIGYTIADIVAKAGFGVLIYMIAVRKSAHDVGVAPAATPAAAE